MNQVRKDKLWMSFVWHLPKTLINWAVVRMFAHATTGKYGSTECSGLTVVEMTKRWEE